MTAYDEAAMHDDELEKTGYGGGVRSTLETVYFKQIGRYDLLSREEEKSLGTKIRSGREALNILALHSKHLQQKDEKRKISRKEKSLVERLKIFEAEYDIKKNHERGDGVASAGEPFLPLGLRVDPSKSISLKQIKSLEDLVFHGKGASKELSEASLRLVVFIAKNYRYSAGLGMLDLIQEGNIGLLRAAEGYDPHTNNRFSTYAGRCIRQSITRAIRKESTIFIPNYLRELLSRFYSLYRKFNGQEEIPKDELIARIEESLEKEVKFNKRCLRSAVLMDRPVLSIEDLFEDSNAYERVIALSNPPSQYDTAQHYENIAILNGYLSILPQKEQKVLELRKGLNGNREHTLEEIGRIFNVTRERIRQIEIRAIDRLRKYVLGEPYRVAKDKDNGYILK